MSRASWRRATGRRRERRRPRVDCIWSMSSTSRTGRRCGLAFSAAAVAWQRVAGPGGVRHCGGAVSTPMCTITSTSARLHTVSAGLGFAAPARVAVEGCWLRAAAQLGKGAADGSCGGSLHGGVGVVCHAASAGAMAGEDARPVGFRGHGGESESVPVLRGSWSGCWALWARRSFIAAT